jgi:hypothetical protein
LQCEEIEAYGCFVLLIHQSKSIYVSNTSLHTGYLYCDTYK